MRKHWDVLLSLISKAINNDETIVMHSHLFTPARINKLIKRLESYGLNFSVITCPRKTSLYERLSIPFVYLLFQWSLPHLHSDGMTVVIRPSPAASHQLTNTYIRTRSLRYEKTIWHLYCRHYCPAVPEFPAAITWHHQIRLLWFCWRTNQWECWRSGTYATTSFST